MQKKSRQDAGKASISQNWVAVGEVDLALFHDEGDVLDGVDVGYGVGGQGDDVGVFAWRDAAEDFGFAEEVGGGGGGGLDGLHGGHAVLHHEGELVDAAVVGADTGVGAEAEFYACMQCFGEVGAMRCA